MTNRKSAGRRSATTVASRAAASSEWLRAGIAELITLTTVIDTGTRTVVARIAVGRNPIQLHATPDDRFVYVANQGSEEEPANTVSVLDVARGIVVDTIRTGGGAHGVAVSDDGRYVFVTNIVDGTVSLIEAASRSVIATFAVGQGPNGVTFAPGRA